MNGFTIEITSRERRIRRGISRSGMAGLLALVLGLLATSVHATTIRSGHSGHWYDPARDGEGWVLEVLDGSRALLYWFTYDEAGRQRWLTAVGHVAIDDAGRFLRFADLVLTTGGRFGPDFDPDAVERTSVGSATLRFHDCNRGEFAFSAFDQNLTIQVERLTRTMATFCESPNGLPGQEIGAEAGQSGSWFDPAHDGEGYSLQWIAPGQALVTWYSFDADGHQYWMLGTGELRDDGRLHLPQMHATRGARFGAAFDPGDVERFEWGELTMELGCDTGQAGYASVLASFGSGAFDLSRLTRPRDLRCPWQPPSLAELYLFTVDEIPPLAEDGQTEVQMRDVGDDGTVYGTDAEGRIYRWQPDGQAPVLWLDEVPETQYPFPGLRVSADAQILLRDGVSDPVIHRFESGWTEIEDISATYAATVIQTMSANGDWLVGRGTSGGGVPWRSWAWNADAGLLELPYSDEVPAWQPLAIADDGQVVLGVVIGPSMGGFPRPVPRYSVVLVDGAGPVLLRDVEGTLLGPARACSADCRTVFGAELGNPTPSHPHAGEAWYWLADGRHAYIGSKPADVPDSFAGWAQPMLASSDGTLAIGRYVLAPGSPDMPVAVFAWTQRTGMVNLFGDGNDLDAQLGDWAMSTPLALSGSGTYVLLSAQHQSSDDTSPFPTRYLRLRLTPWAQLPFMHPVLACDARAAIWTLGQPATDVLLDQARADAGASTARFVRQGGDGLTADFNAARLSLIRNDADVIVRVDCG